MDWIPVSNLLPEDETPVIVFCKGQERIGEIRWEHPTYEETHSAFRYWDDPYDDGQSWEWEDVTHWMPLPKAPE